MTERETNIAKLIGLRIKEQDPKAVVILFGSHAIGQAKEESDWDVLILIDRPKLIPVVVSIPQVFFTIYRISKLHGLATGCFCSPQA